MKAETLIQDLINRTQGVLNDAERLKLLPEEDLNKRPGEGKWSALEAIQHLNLYGDFYTPEIEKRLKESKHKKSEKFKSSWLGNYFANAIAPKEKLNKMNAFKNMNPAGSDLDKSVLTDFTNHQQKVLEFLNLSRDHDMSKIKTAISISKVIKLRLGDTFRVVIYHNQRHMIQAFKAAGLK